MLMLSVYLVEELRARKSRSEVTSSLLPRLRGRHCEWLECDCLISGVYRPVNTIENHVAYCVATRHSNNTAELTAIIEALRPYGRSWRQAQATQQELARSQSGVKGKRLGGAVPLQKEQGIGAFASKYQHQPVRRRGLQVERMGFSQLVRNDSATILDVALTSLRFDAGLLRNISTELYHVLIMLTRGRAQQLVLRAAEREGFEAYRLFLRQYEPISTVTTVSKLVDLLATTFSGSLMDSLTDFHRGMKQKKRCQI